MQTVKVNKGELLTALKANRTKHISAYKKAMDGYQRECEKALTSELKKIRADQTHVININEERPTSYEKSYDHAIQMVSMSVDNVIELSYHEFGHYVMDNWEWSGVAMANFTKYSASK